MRSLLIILLTYSCIGPQHVGTIKAQYVYDHTTDIDGQVEKVFQFNTLVIDGVVFEVDHCAPEGIGCMGYYLKDGHIKVLVTKREIVLYQRQYQPDGKFKYVHWMTYSNLRRVRS